MEEDIDIYGPDKSSVSAYTGEGRAILAAHSYRLFAALSSFSRKGLDPQLFR